jgi:hypothetical protein
VTPTERYEKRLEDFNAHPFQPEAGVATTLLPINLNFPALQDGAA